MTEKKLLIVARVVSALFNPFYLPVVGLLIPLLLSPFYMLPWPYKLTLLAMTYVLTALLPTALIRLYIRYEGRSFLDVNPRERRMIPYVISIACYLLCYYLMRLMHIPAIMRSILLAALVIQLVSAIVNHWSKISTHMAAVGGMAGALAAFAAIFSFNPIWWLSIVILVAGVVGTSRMLLLQHSLGQICGGFIVGLLTALITVLTA